MAATSTLRQVIDDRIDGGLETFVAERRHTAMSWRRIARAVAVATNGEIDVSDETLRRWFEAEIAAPRSDAA